MPPCDRPTESTRTGVPVREKRPQTETELKYAIDEESAAALFGGPVLGIEGGQAIEIIPMEAVYLDTADGALCRARIALRFRREGAQAMATVKWETGRRPSAVQAGASSSAAAGEVDDVASAPPGLGTVGAGDAAGLSVRGEYNASVSADFLAKPDVTVFAPCDIYATLVRAAGAPLQPVMEMRFTRRQAVACAGDAVCMVSWDRGSIHTGRGDAPISEMEVELLDGPLADMLQLGRSLRARFHLQPLSESKYARGLALLEAPREEKT